MPFYSNSTRWVGWLFVLGCSGVICTINPLHADNPLPPEVRITDNESALLRTLAAYTSERGLRVHQQALGDLDGDGLLDVAAHVIRHDESTDSYSALVIALAQRGKSSKPAVVSHVEHGLICPDCPMGTGEGVSLPTQTLRIEDGRLLLCEAWGLLWRAEQCARLRLDENAVLRVEHHAEQAHWSSGPSSISLDFDFVSGRGRRAYFEHPLEAGYPFLERESSFTLLFAHRSEVEPTVDGVFDEEAWVGHQTLRFAEQSDLVQGASHWQGSHDLSAELRAVWTDEALYLAIEVEDDTLILGDCSSPASLVHRDHVQVWLDVSPDARDSSDSAAAEEHRRVYQQHPFRHGVDASVFNVAIGAGNEQACVTPLLPREGFVTGAPTAAFVRSEKGYRIELALPAALFGVDALSSLEGRRQGLGFSIDVHDFDDEDEPQRLTRLASSELRWGDPFTFGELLMPKQPEQLPEFPFDWGSWLE